MINKAIPRCAKQIPAICLLLLPLLAIISSCENDLNKVRQISANQIDTVVERTTGVDMIFSDSAIVKLRIITPMLLEYQTKKPYKLMPKGIKIIFYDKVTHAEAGNIIADTGIYRETEKLIELHKNVVATNAQGDTFKSDELYWDQVTKKIYSHKHVNIIMSNGNIMDGDGFESDDNFINKSIYKSTATLHVNEKAVQ